MASWKDLPASPAAASTRHAPLKNLQKKLSNALLQHKTSNTSLSSSSASGPDRETSDKSSSLSAEDCPLLLQQPRQATTGSSKRDSFLDHLNQNPEPFKLSPAPPGRHSHLACHDTTANEVDQDSSRRQQAQEEVAFFTASKAARTLGLGTSPAIMESHQPHYRDRSGKQPSRSPAPSSPSDYFGTAAGAETETLEITTPHYALDEDQAIPPYRRAVTSPSTFGTSKMTSEEAQQQRQRQQSEKAPLPISKGIGHSIYEPSRSFQQQPSHQRPLFLTRKTSPISSDRSHIRSESSPVPAQGSSPSAHVNFPSPPFSAGLYPPSPYSPQRAQRQLSKLSRSTDETYSPDREQDELEAFFTAEDTGTSSSDSLLPEDLGSPPDVGPIAAHSLRKLATSRKRQQSALGIPDNSGSNTFGQEHTHFQHALDALEGRGSASERGTGSAPQSTGSRFSDSGSEDDSESPDQNEPDEEAEAEAREADGTTQERPPSMDEHQTVCSACTSICTERLDVSTQTTSFDTTAAEPRSDAEDEQEALAAKAQRLELALQESAAQNEELKQALSSSSNRQEC